MIGYQITLPSFDTRGAPIASLRVRVQLVAGRTHGILRGPRRAERHRTGLSNSFVCSSGVMCLSNEGYYFQWSVARLGFRKQMVSAPLRCSEYLIRGV